MIRVLLGTIAFVVMLGGAYSAKHPKTPAVSGVIWNASDYAEDLGGRVRAIEQGMPFPNGICPICGLQAPKCEDSNPDGQALLRCRRCNGAFWVDLKQEKR